MSSSYDHYKVGLRATRYPTALLTTGTVARLFWMSWMRCALSHVDWKVHSKQLAEIRAALKTQKSKVDKLVENRCPTVTYLPIELLVRMPTCAGLSRVEEAPRAGEPVGLHVLVSNPDRW
ncbi:hypothetical protein PISMIDRAFT_271525 [Pisolithus microcarpus 441]|uniref:Uncharacterized protein n=1 Tax=Pisolithus microcarpus 441 TaxID=765257 RepID=A0A0C9YMQ0_9AGAM|nr:hypothetical protein PISMIDRAFT_271525 [Pisolithus microcarpus 441]